MKWEEHEGGWISYKDLQIDHEDTSTGITPREIDMLNQKVNLVFCNKWILVTGMLENSVLGIFSPLWKNKGN